ncbi:MAG TPA: type II toxin-antitoxin system HicB family antitoxin [Ardenticatenaceae bacterium]|jgi:predicted RNase H-like HicB family nuclease
MYRYNYRVFWSDEDESFVAIVEGVPELCRLSAFGDTPEAALADMATVLQLAEEMYRAEGKELPYPQGMAQTV